MDINYFMKIQNAYGTKNRREKELVKINNEMSRHFEDTYGTVDILLNGTPTKLMIIKDTDNNTFKKKIKSVHGKTKGENIINSNIEAVKLAMQMKELGIVVICIFALSLSAGKIQKVKLLNVTFMQKILQNIQMVLQEIILSPLETTSMD